MKSFFCTFCMAVLFTTSFAKNTDVGLQYRVPKNNNTHKGFDVNKLFTGGGLGFGFLQNGFSFSATPLLGYRITKEFHVGATLGVNYFQQGIDYINPVTNLHATYRYKSPYYSVSLFARYILLNSIILQVEPEINNYKILRSLTVSNSTGKVTEDSYRNTIPSVLVGVGYSQNITSGSGFVIMVMYDLIQNPNSPYYKVPVIRGGINIGLGRF